MDAAPARWRLATLLLLLLASGVSGLAYQVLWLRELSLIFGVTVHAAATVLAAFMGGLALGSAAAGRVARRIHNPLLAFGIAEVSIGLSAVAVRAAFDRAAPIDVVLHDWLGASDAALTVGRFAVASALLLVPTSLMGLTMPLVSAAGSVRTALGERLGLVYGVNTAGGVVGALVTGFYALGTHGADATLSVAAAISVAVGCVAIGVSRFDRVGVAAAAPEAAPRDAAPHDTSPAPADVISPGVLTTVVAASGAASLALEVLWFRALTQQMAATTYAFTAMLAVVLAGIAIGSLAASWILRRRRRWIDWLAGLNYATAAGVFGSLALLAWAARRAAAGQEPGPAAALAMLPAMFCLGASLPIALHVGVGSGGTAAEVSRRVGRLYAANVAGAVVGSLLGGFVLLPQFGVRTAILVAGAVFVLAAVLLRASTGRFAVRRDLPALAALLAIAVGGPDPLDAAFARRHGGGMAAAWRHDGVQATVMVHATRNRRVLYIDGLHQAADHPGMVKVHRTLGHLAMALHRDPRHALVIGLGGGATAGAVARHRPATLDIVELNEGVRLAAPLFAHVSYDVLHQPGTTLHADDARSFLLTTDSRFDVVTADIIQPTHAGAGGLYSREYFQRVRDRLRPGGLVLQWVGQREDTAYKLIARTFLDVFPDATAWVDGTLLVGIVGPLTISRGAFERQLTNPDTRAALAAVDLHTFDDLVRWYSAGPATLRAFIGPGPTLTDDRPLVEYFRALPRGEGPARLDRLRDDGTAIVAP